MSQKMASDIIYGSFPQEVEVQVEHTELWDTQ